MQGPTAFKSGNFCVSISVCSVTYIKAWVDNINSGEFTPTIMHKELLRYRGRQLRSSKPKLGVLGLIGLI